VLEAVVPAALISRKESELGRVAAWAEGTPLTAARGTSPLLLLLGFDSGDVSTLALALVGAEAGDDTGAQSLAKSTLTRLWASESFRRDSNVGSRLLRSVSTEENLSELTSEPGRARLALRERRTLAASKLNMFTEELAAGVAELGR
jgi:hypothetical protein